MTPKDLVLDSFSREEKAHVPGPGPALEVGLGVLAGALGWAIAQGLTEAVLSQPALGPVPVLLGLAWLHQVGRP